METRVASKQPQWLEKPVRLSEQKWPEGTKPVVSIFCLTYNHEEYIQDAIESFLIQKTTFPVKIFIHDDASSDGTSKIIREYEEKYPILISTVIQKQNRYKKDRFSFFFEQLRELEGKYIALCEGDDYWTQPDKLQRQVGILENDPSVSLVFHNAWVRHPESRRDYFQCQQLEKERFTLADVISREWFVPSASMVFRASNRLMEELAPISFAGDMILLLSAARCGDLAFIDQVWSVYRKHQGGVSHELQKDLKNFYEGQRINMAWVLYGLDCILRDTRLRQTLESRIADLLGQTGWFLFSRNKNDQGKRLKEIQKRIHHFLLKGHPASLDNLAGKSDIQLEALTKRAAQQAIQRHFRETCGQSARSAEGRVMVAAMRDSLFSGGFSLVGWSVMAGKSILLFGNALLRKWAK